MPDPLPALLCLSPERWPYGFALLAFFAATCALLRAALMLEALFSRLTHLALSLLAVLPAFVTAGVLVHAAATYPARAWTNLAVALGVYVAWGAGILAPRLVRPDVHSHLGSTVRWLAAGACVTFPVGAIAAIAFR